MKRFLAFAVLSLFAMSAAFAQQSADESVKESSKVYYEVSSSKLDPEFGGNGSALNSLVSLLKEISADPDKSVTSIHYFSSASPEGPKALNEKLSRERLASLRRYVEANAPVNGAAVTESSKGPDFSCPDKASYSDYRMAGVEIIYSVVTPAPEPEPEPETVIAPEPKPEPAQKPVPEPTPAPVPVAEPLVKVEEPCDYCDECWMGLKTNLLYDALLVPNLAVEVPAAEDWTLEGSFMYAGWNSKNSQKKWNITAAGLEVRRWFGNSTGEPLHGHHVGAYGLVGSYDVALLHGEENKCDFGYSAGLTYGYAFPICKHFNIDCSISAGYIGGDYDINTLADGKYVFKTSKSRNYWGVTRAEVSLVYVIGFNNHD